MKHKILLSLMLFAWLAVTATHSFATAAIDPSPEPPRKGQKSEAVDDLQRNLSLLGFYYTLPEEGYNKQTELAVQRYQEYLNALREIDEIAILLFPDPIKVDGKLTRAQHDYLNSNLYRCYLHDLSEGMDEQAVFRMEVRLSALGLDTGMIDTVFDSDTSHALKQFQARNRLPETGAADQSTQRQLFSSNAIPAQYPAHWYQLYISNDDQRVYAYMWSRGSYSLLSREILCSTGLPNTPTPNGVFSADGPVSRWCYFPVYGCWAQYAYRIEGAVLFHSVLYATADESTLRESSVQNLGSKSSHGCVRMSVEDSKWIYDNCLAGVTIIVF